MTAKSSSRKIHSVIVMEDNKCVVLMEWMVMEIN